MNEMETPLGILGAEAERVDAEGARDQGGDQGVQGRVELARLRLGEFARKCVVAAELVHHVGIAPVQQQRVLFGREAGRAAAGEIGVGEGGAERVERADGVGGKAVERPGVSGGYEGEEAAELRQFQTVECDRRGKVALGGEGGQKVGFRPALGQMEGRLDCRVKAVFAGRAGDVVPRGGKALDVGRRGRSATFHVPAEPVGAEPAQGTLRRVVDSVALESHVRGSADVSTSRQVMVP